MATPESNRIGLQITARVVLYREADGCFVEIVVASSGRGRPWTLPDAKYVL